MEDMGKNPQFPNVYTDILTEITQGKNMEFLN